MWKCFHESSFIFWINQKQGCKFSDFSLIADFCTLTPLKITFEMSFIERVSHDFMIDPHILIFFQTFSMSLTYFPAEIKEHEKYPARK